MSNKILENLTTSQTDLNSRVFNLVIGRVFKRVYSSFDEKGKENMDKIFLSDDNEKKEEFIKKYIPDFKKLFEEETKKIEDEIKIEIEKQT